MAFQNLAFFLLGQSVEDLSQLTAQLPKHRLAPPLVHKHHVVFTVKRPIFGKNDLFFVTLCLFFVTLCFPGF